MQPKFSDKLLEQWFGVSFAEWPADKGLHIPNQFDPRKRTVLLVHGLDSGVTDLQRLTDACVAYDWQVMTFDYPNVEPLAWSGDRFGGDLQSFTEQFPSARLVVVAHSMGGLIVRYSVEASKTSPSCLTNIFFLGTPHLGSSLAAESDVLRLIDKPVFPQREALVRRLNDGLGEARIDLMPGSSFLQRLNASKRPVGLRYHAGVGITSFVTKQQYDTLIQNIRQRLDDPNLNPVLQARLLKLVNAPEWKPGEGDGAVSVASANLSGSDSGRTFELNHLDLMNLPGQEPQKSEVFQWIRDTLEKYKRSSH